MNVEYHPSTVSDLNTARHHYNKQLAGLGDAFRTEVYATIQRIRNDPSMYMETEGTRRALLRRFPYSVIYRLMGEDTVRILLIRHHKRHPQFGMRRQ